MYTSERITSQAAKLPCRAAFAEEAERARCVRLFGELHEFVKPGSVDMSDLALPKPRSTKMIALYGDHIVGGRETSGLHFSLFVTAPVFMPDRSQVRPNCIWWSERCSTWCAQAYHAMKRSWPC